MRTLSSVIDNCLIEVGDFHRITVSGFSGEFNEIEQKHEVDDAEEFASDSEAAVAFHRMIESGKYHTVTCWAFKKNEFFPDSKDAETAVEIETWYKNPPTANDFAHFYDN